MPVCWPGLNTPHARTMVKTLKLALYLFLEIDFKFGFKSIILVQMELSF
jgi:hypothetical protein